MRMMQRYFCSACDDGTYTLAALNVKPLFLAVQGQPANWLYNNWTSKGELIRCADT